MKEKVLLSKYSALVQNIEAYFKTSEQSIHKARNEIKVIDFEGEEVVVKSFKEPNFVNKIAYLLYKDSKAKRAYDYAHKIVDFTPTPIGYREFYKGAFLKRSYFVSQKFEYDFSMKKPLDDPSFANREALLQAFVAFTKMLHDNNILHLDYSPGNILIKKEGSSYHFKIVDINRMKFKKLSQKDRMKNFAKLGASDDDLSFMIYSYSQDKKDVSLAIQYSYKHQNFRAFKKRIKKLFK
ncbi:MAG: lipopolysaccharide kinase InaA family protein [Campylobacterota bacterium]|nr:lipopolysaccharide kinase InaA family protein [Campylobacterota bacterium]